jgi:hypothetical protein
MSTAPAIATAIAQAIGVRLSAAAHPRTRLAGAACCAGTPDGLKAGAALAPLSSQTV